MKKIFILFLMIFALVGCTISRSEYELLREEIKKDAYNCAVETGYDLTYSEWLTELQSGTIIIKFTIEGKTMWKKANSEEWVFMDSFGYIIIDKMERIQKVITEYFTENKDYYDIVEIDMKRWINDTISGGHEYDPIKHKIL